MKQHAEKKKTWPEWRKKAITFLQNSIKKEKSGLRSSLWCTGDSDLLVCIYMWEKNFDEAWSQAKKKGCHKSTWLELAKVRGNSHPEDAVKVYQSYVGPTIELGNNGSYEEAVDYLKFIKKWMSAIDKIGEFNQYLSSVCESYKRKRNFVKFAQAAKL